jgi:FkbM family methyltransferase
MERRLRALHELLPEAQAFPELLGPYVAFLRCLRERLHPVGVADIRRVETRSGLTFCVDLGDRLGADFYYGYYAEMFESLLFMRCLERGAVAVDVGANFGFYAAGAAKAVGGSGLVHAFEPDPAAFELLRGTVEANGLDNVRCHDVCVGGEDGETDYSVMEESAFSGRGETGRARMRERIRVAERRLDSVLAATSAVAGIKVDVEGWEHEVLRGARGIITRSPEIVVLLEVSAKNLDQARREALTEQLAWLFEAGFTGWVPSPIPPGVRRVASVGEAAALQGANLFLARPGSRAGRRLLAAAEELHGQALHEFAKEVGLADERVLRRHSADPFGGSHLHRTVLTAIVRQWQARSETFERAFRRVETESQARLVELGRVTALLEAAEARCRELEERERSRAMPSDGADQDPMLGEGRDDR